MTSAATATNPFSESKLLGHLDRLAQWRATGSTVPVMIGIDITNICNHRCPGCVGSMGQDTTTIPLADMERLIGQFAAAGVRSIQLTGGGDPSCHPHLPEILRTARAHGLESALFTNGQVLRDDAVEAIVECCTWVRVSLDADSPDMHARVHGVRPESFHKVLDNIARLVARRRETGSPVTIGTSYLVGPHTASGMRNASVIARDLGVDYIRLRPFFNWDGKSPFTPEEARDVLADLGACRALSTETFRVSFPAGRTEWIAESGDGRSFTACNVHHFVTVVTADMKVYLCCHTRDMDRYCLGDLSRQSFADLWESERRRQVYENIDFRDCATPCMMSGHNELLDRLAAPVAHANFL